MIDALCEQRWPTEQHPGKKDGHMLHVLYHQGPWETVCLQQSLNHVCLWPGYQLEHDTAKHGYSGVMKESNGKWNGALLSSVMRIGYICMQVMDVHLYGVDLMSFVFRGVPSPTTHRPHLRLHGVWGYQLELAVTFGVSSG